MSKLVIKKQDGYSAWVLASLAVEMAYKALKKSYEKGSPRRLEFKILYERLKFQLNLQQYKNYSSDSIYLTFSPYDNSEVVWFVEFFIAYLEKNNIDSLLKYELIKTDFLKQIEELKKVD